MTVLPFSLDPLIAEAKQRMRRRRLLIAALIVAVACSAFGAASSLTGKSSAPGSVLAPVASNLPPLSNQAARAFWCGDTYNASGHGGCHSPDGKWAVVVDNEGTGCTLTVTNISTGQHQRIGQARLGSCVPDLWIGDRFVVQEDIYGTRGRVVSFSPPNRRPDVLARFATFVVSPDRRWIAGQSRSRFPDGSHAVAVMSLTGRTCRVVAQTTGAQYVSVDKSPWSMRNSPLPTSPYRDPVSWRTVVKDGRKIRVDSGPGTGFTRNSRSVIVAKWERRGGSHATRLRAVHKRLVKLNISSLHTPCPAGLVPRG